VRPFRFGVVAATAPSAAAWRETARRAEALGYATLLVPDHLGGQLAPVPALAAAATATTTLRVASQVFANDFRHPVILAKEAATLDLLSDGRFELGLGAGWLREEYERVGIPFAPPAERVDRLQEALAVVKACFRGEPVTFAGAHYRVAGHVGAPAPVQRPHPPILIGGGGRQMLGLAAREADIVSLVPRALPAGSLDVEDCGPEAVARKVGWIREAAGPRFDTLELSILVFAAVVTDDPAGEAARRGERIQMAPAAILDSPHFLLGPREAIEERIRAARARHGLSYVVVFDESLEAFAPVVARLAGT